MAEDANGGGDGDAAGGCEISSRMCRCVAHDFCDDFDVDGEAFGARWKASAIGAAGPLLKGDASIGFIDQGLSPPRAVHATAEDPKSSTFALLMNELDHDALYPGRAFVGFRQVLDIQLETLVTGESKGPIQDAGSALVASVVRFDGINAKGIAVIVTQDAAYLYAAAGLLEPNTGLDGGEAELVRLLTGDLLALSRSWLHVEILVADAARAVREGYATCQGLAGNVAAASLGPTRTLQGCVPIPSSMGMEWAQKPSISVGGLLFGGKELVLRQDNVAFDFLAP